MKKDGFIATSLIYSFFLVFIGVLTALVGSYIANKQILNRFNEDIIAEMNGTVIIDDSIFLTDGKGAITGLTDYGKTFRHITIPEEINGVAITKLGNIGNSSGENDMLSNVFVQNTVLESIDLGNVTEISAAAFWDCINLKEVTGKNVTTIYHNAFNGCINLETINVPNLSYLGGASFQGCSSLTTFNLANVTEIEYGTFSSCTSLNNIDLSKVTEIGGRAFRECSSLESINLSSIESLSEEETFYGCDSLTQIILNENLFIDDYSTFEVSSSVKPLHTTIINANDDVENYDWESVGRYVTFVD